MVEYKKCSIKRETVLEDGFPEECVDVRMQLFIDQGDTMEEVRASLHQRLDQRFNRLFYSEYRNMKERIAEGEQWVQQGLFADHLDISVDDLLDNGDE